MNSQDYVRPVNLGLDCEKLRNQVIDIISRSTLYDKRKIVFPAREYEYTSTILSKIPILSSHCTVITLPNGIKPHIDFGRNCALNVPIANCEKSRTIFHKDANEYKPAPGNSFIKLSDQIDLEEIFSFTLTEPVIFNTSITHSVVTYSNLERTILSWSFNLPYTYSQVCEILNDFINDLKLEKIQ